MPVEIRLPQLGESIHEGTVARWLKRPGDRVEKYEPLVEISTDKVNVEMPSPHAGVLVELLVAEGETRPVGSGIALIDTSAAEGPVGPREPSADEGSAVSAVPTGPAPSAAPTPGADTAGPQPGARTRLSPLVRRLAEEHQIPPAILETLPGTGAGGRVTKDDLLRHLEGQSAAAPARQTAPEAPGASPGPTDERDELVALPPIRRAIAHRMAQSSREIPQAYGAIEVDMTAVVAWREAQKDAWRLREGVALTYTAFFVRAACEALRAVPTVNASWSDDGIVLHRAINVGIGIALDDGLIVPVIRRAHQLDLAALARALDDVTRRARTGRLGLDDVQGGTFTITNPGVFGSIWSVPIVVPGQAAILTTDAIVKRAVVRDDAIAIRPVMHLGLSFDHRIFDGAVAMQFLTHMKGWFETFRDAR